MQILTNNIVNDGLVLYLDAGIKGSYPGSGTTWTDLAKGNDGTLTNGPTFNSANGGGIVFDGTDDFVQHGSVADANSQSLTVELWVKFDATPTIERLAGKMGASGNRGWVFNINGEPQLLIYQSSVSKITRASTGLPSAGIYNLAASFTSGSQKIYVNGSEQSLAEGGSFTGTFDTSTNDLNVGRGFVTTPDVANTDPHIEGKIFQVRIYNRALSAAEVAQNFEATRNRFGI